ADERPNLLALAKYLGYSPNPTTPAFVDLDVFQLIPAKVVDGVAEPDYKYTLTILPNMQATTEDGVSFITEEAVDFSVDTEDSPREVSVFSRDSANQVQTFLLKKSAKSFSGTIVTSDFSVGDAEQFFRINLPETNVIDVKTITDSDNNRWYEVDYLSQDIVYTDTENIQRNDGDFYRFKEAVPSIIGSLRTSRKFIKGIYQNDQTYLEFGAGLTENQDDQVVLNIKNSQQNPYAFKDVPIDPTAFLNSKSYGLAPANTTLSVEYIVGGGIQSNTPSNTITNISRIEFSDALDDLSDAEQQLITSLRNSIKVNNEEAASGGKATETNEEIRQNSLAFFNAQNRVVTKEDYLARTLSMPAKFGGIAKAHVATDNEISFNASLVDPELDKSFDINVYSLAFNNSKQLIQMNDALIYNLKQYISRFRMLTDEVKILNGFIVNLGVDFEITTFAGENKREVLSNCIAAAQDFFDIDNMNFNQAINISRFELALANIEGVQSVQKVEFKNLTINDGDYSDVEYNIQTATIDKILYPSLDPAIFEVKFPNKDIKGRVL
ncbi:MAG: hypothetical protein ACXACA_07325, partial [Candidatus Ranarchaeia archaeon]